MFVIAALEEDNNKKSCPTLLSPLSLLNHKILAPNIRSVSALFAHLLLSEVLLGHSLVYVSDRLSSGLTQICSFWLCGNTSFKGSKGLLYSLPEFGVLICRLHKDAISST